jgi:hypothetical protein
MVVYNIFFGIYLTINYFETYYFPNFLLNNDYLPVFKLEYDDGNCNQREHTLLSLEVKMGKRMPFLNVWGRYFERHTGIWLA